jgi:hypothetical protein
MSEIHKTTHVDGFLTFVCVDHETEGKRPHGIVMDEPANEEEKEIRDKANLL